MFGVGFPSDEPVVCAVFGIQYQGETPTKEKAALIDAFDNLIQPSASYIDNILQEGQKHQRGWTTRIWLSYWTSKSHFSTWWDSPEVSAFWSSLRSDDAGVYREVMTISPRRTQFGTNKETLSGLANVGHLVPNTTTVFYWGCYRDRYQEASPDNRMNSSLEEAPSPAQLSGTNIIRPGRVHMTRFPENLCFLVEGQDHSAIVPEEKSHWMERFDDAVTTWMADLRDAGPKAGVLDARFCYEPGSGRYRENCSSKEEDPRSSLASLSYRRKVQIFWFLDHRHLEKIGRSNKGHSALRGNFIESYCPAGPMGNIGQLMLWVESSILKADEIDAEYVGCLDGTGFTAFMEHPAFKM
ncbi:heme-containing dehydratase protein [Phyllosticta capitalensis]|uniref:Heme-containing dehydratase protein n=1 Tax=Phyllosticta capitalensis TaxID=121624 RepID=A0ABR1YM70_9PEZI